MAMNENFNKVKFALGVSDFSEIIDGKCYYCDKTLLVKDLIDNKAKVLLFTRPRRFGKTLNMSMLKTFFEKPVDGKDTSHYFKNLKIWQQGEKYRAEQGKRPVIYITLKDVQFLSYEDSIAAIWMIISEEFDRHSYLEKSPKLNKENLIAFKELRSKQGNLAFSLKILAKLLNIHYGLTPLILIDEYDAPIQSAYIHGYYEQMIVFMRNFLSSAFKDNPYLYIGVLTGITRVSKESIFSGLNNLTVDTILDKKFSQYFGLTEEDVKEMLDFYGVPEKMSEVQEWYDGYIFGKREMYNPWSLINYMANECEPRDYWANTSANELAGKLIKNMEQDEKQPLYGLLRGKKVNSSINMNIVYTDLDKDPTLAYGLLAQTGYLKASDAKFSNGIYQAGLEIPNKEIQSVYSKEIIKRMADDSTRKAAAYLHEATIFGDAEEMQREISDFLLSSCSYHDLTEEKDYQNLLIGLLGTMRTMYEIKSNRESGHGRSDILLRPKLNVKNADKMPGIIIELKHYKATEEESKNPEKLEERLKQEAEEALRQIDRKDYEAEILSSGCKKVIKYGAAFSGKKAVILQPPGQQKPKKMPYEEWG